MTRLNGKVALVTGASRGIGRGVALRLAQEGADVVVNYHSHSEEAAQLVNAIDQLGRRGLAWQADVADRQAVEEMVKGTVEQLGSLDILVANAAVEYRAPILDDVWENDMRMFEVNQFGVIHSCRAAARQMVKQIDEGRKGGKVVIISSVCADFSPVGQGIYNVTKAAVSHFGRALARELVDYRINVNIIHPGWIDTPGERDMFGDAIMEAANEKALWGRIGKPEDVANVVVFLVSDEADLITGSTLTVDGGETLMLGDLNPIGVAPAAIPPDQSPGE